MTKPVTVVLDTSVLVADPEVLNRYPEADVVIPLIVVEELDRHKRRSDDVGANARRALRALEAVDGTNKVRIEINGVHMGKITDVGLDPKAADNRIIAAALGCAEKNDTLLVSNDTALRVKAMKLGVPAQEWVPVKVERARVGWQEVDVTGGLIDEVYSSRSVPVEDAVKSSEKLSELIVNEGAVLRFGTQSALVRLRSDGRLHLVDTQPFWNLKPRTAEQKFAGDLLRDPGVQIVALDGRAGTGKTIMSIAAGLQQAVEENMYDRVCVFRPIIPVGRQELGFLPGDYAAKVEPWMAAIEDNLVALAAERDPKSARNVYEQLTASGKLITEAVTFLRGRSIQRSFIIVDELQNLEVSTLKTILTRVGEGTKIVFTGDLEQIDSPFLSSDNNALSALVSTFSGQDLFGHVRLVNCERSRVAELAAEIL